MSILPNDVDVPLIPLDDWKASVHMNVFTPDDGFGYWANETHYIADRDRNVFDLKDIPSTATHVLWFNK